MKTFTIKLAVLWQWQWCVHWDLRVIRNFLYRAQQHTYWAQHSMWHKAQHLQLRQQVLSVSLLNFTWTLTGWIVMDINLLNFTWTVRDVNAPSHVVFPVSKLWLWALSFERTELDHRRGGWPLVVVASADLNPAAAGFLYQLMKPLATSATTRVQRPLIWRHTHTAFTGVNNQQNKPPQYLCVCSYKQPLQTWGHRCTECTGTEKK